MQGLSEVVEQLLVQQSKARRARTSLRSWAAVLHDQIPLLVLEELRSKCTRPAPVKSMIMDECGCLLTRRRQAQNKWRVCRWRRAPGSQGVKARGALKAQRRRLININGLRPISLPRCAARTCTILYHVDEHHLSVVEEQEVQHGHQQRGQCCVEQLPTNATPSSICSTHLT